MTLLVHIIVGDLCGRKLFPFSAILLTQIIVRPLSVTEMALHLTLGYLVTREVCGRLNDHKVHRSCVRKTNPDNHPSTTMLVKWYAASKHLHLGLIFQRILFQKSCHFYGSNFSNLPCATMLMSCAFEYQSLATTYLLDSYGGNMC